MIKETKKAPTIRFRDFTDDWEQRKLSDVAERVTRKNKNLESTLPLTISAQYGLIDQNEFFDKRIASKDVSGYYLIRKGEFAYNKSTSNDAPWGAIKRLNRYESGVLSTLYIVFCILDKSKTCSDYLASYYDTNLWHKEVKTIAAEGARNHGLLNIAPADFFETKLMIPKNFEEQQMIGEYFSNLDNLITLHQRKFDQLKTAKKYFLQNMFPAKGEKVPRIRFQGFTGEWEQRKFGEIAEYKKGPFGSALKKEFFIPDSDISIKVYEQQNAINKDWTLSRYYISQEYAQKLKAFEVHSGDIIVSCAGTIGEIYELPAQSRPGIINQALMRIRVNKNIVCKDIFKLAFSNMIDSLSREFSNGSAIKNIPPFADLKPMKVLLPDKTEQKLIGDFFTDIDKTITLHQRKLNQFQTMKKFMLQNLFI